MWGLHTLEARCAYQTFSFIYYSCPQWLPECSIALSLSDQPSPSSLLQVTNMFVMYIVADACWLYFEPEAIPSLHGVIYFHHIVTLLLLLFPLKHPEFSSFTCLDGKQAFCF